MAGNTVLIVESNVVNIAPSGFYLYGRDFFDASKRKRWRTNSMVPYFLLCQATELGLKAFLLWRGLTIKELRSAGDFGHNLTKLLAEAKSRGLSTYVRFSAADDTTITAATTFYDVGQKGKAGKRLQYFDMMTVLTGNKGLPDLHALKRITRRLVQNPRLEAEYLKG